jgi:3-deoxy-D-manno-octulosonic-acid transferase
VDIIFARSEQDQELFEQLAKNFNKSFTVGNLKFSQTSTSPTHHLTNFTQRKYILAASTHKNEEFQLAQCWLQINLRKTLLVIAPRHPDRSNGIIKQLSALNINISVRSKGDAITENTDIYLADTLGELPSFMQHAEIVFMGGSLIPHGGQNFLEAARLNKAIIVGPYMHNFQNEVDLFNQQHACIQVQNITELGAAIQSLLINAKARINLGHCAKQLMDAQTGIAEVYLHKLAEHYPKIFN